MRFHSNVCAIGQCVPNIGLITLKKHACIFDDLGINERAINLFEQDIDKELFDDLKKYIVETIEEADTIRKQYREINTFMNKKIEKVYERLNEIIK